MLNDISITDSYLESLDKTIENDLMLDEIYGKERGHRIVFFGIQLDEMCGAARADICRK